MAESPPPYYCPYPCPYCTLPATAAPRALPPLPDRAAARAARGPMTPALPFLRTKQNLFAPPTNREGAPTSHGMTRFTAASSASILRRARPTGVST